MQRSDCMEFLNSFIYLKVKNLTTTNKTEENVNNLFITLFLNVNESNRIVICN